MSRLTPLLFIGAGLLAVILFSGGNNKDDSKDNNKSNSSIYNSNPDGMKGLYLTLKNWEPRIQRWTRPLYFLTEEILSTGTIVIANPAKPLSPMEKIALDEWVGRGGLVVLMKEEDWPIRQSGYHDEEESLTFREVYEITNEESKMPLTLFQEEGNGNGKMIVLPFISNNQNLKGDPEASLFLIQEILQQEGPIYFDEYHLNLGNQDNFTVSILKFMKTNWGWVALHIAIVFLASLFLSSPITKKSMESRDVENLSMRLIHARGVFLENLQAKDFCRQAMDQYNKKLMAERKDLTF